MRLKKSFLRAESAAYVLIANLAYHQAFLLRSSQLTRSERPR